MIAAAPVPEPVTIMGVDVTPFESYSQAVQCVGGTIEAGEKAFWVAINPQKVYRAWHDPEVKATLDRADVGICDGVGVSLAARILHGITLERCTGCDLFFHMMPVAAQRGWKIFLLGASAHVSECGCAKLLQRYPGLQIVGRRDGYFTNDAEVVRQINDSGADMLFVAMGSPKQEMWIARHMDDIDARFFMGVGGTLDVASETNKRAPKVFRKTGTEFLYQLATQPHRWRRQIVYTPFMLRVLGRRLADARQDELTRRGDP